MRAGRHELVVLFATALGSAAAFWLLQAHWAHVLGYAPYLLFLVCPLMHLFHRHGSHHHGTLSNNVTEPPAR